MQTLSNAKEPADAIGVAPEVIWPTRYMRDGKDTTGENSNRNHGV